MEPVPQKDGRPIEVCIVKTSCVEFEKCMNVSKNFLGGVHSPLSSVCVCVHPMKNDGSRTKTGLHHDNHTIPHLRSPYRTIPTYGKRDRRRELPRRIRPSGTSRKDRGLRRIA